ncbi:ATP-binding cassette domain-containing protein [Hydrocarboniphaga sp.]|uniref:ATP-binding cassette domain-containing protein n=1 Tax=Hydrocarboniphaga sp. TaxID=2033016 RepID=UPI003D0F9F82
MLEVDLHFSRGGFALDIAHRLGEGVTGICGPSGSGKSTLLALVAGLLKPQSGQIRFDSQTLVYTAQRVFVPAHHRGFGLVFQDGQLFPHLSVRANLLYGWRGLAPQQRHFTLESVCELLEIGGFLERRPDQLSGGQRQRVALGRALLYSPRLLLLDEPLSSLDTRLKSQILPFLKRVRDETRLPMLYVSHAPDEVAYLADRVLNIDDGKLVA